MAQLPPTQGTAGPVPPRPQLSVVPGQAPPPQPPGGVPPPPQVAPPPSPPTGGPGSPNTGLNAFLAAFLTDVSANLPPEWQMVDIAATALQIAMRGKSMQKAEKTVAALTSVHNVLKTLLNARIEGSAKSGPQTPEVQSSATGSDADAGGVDADAQPSAGGSSGGDGGDA